MEPRKPGQLPRNKRELAILIAQVQRATMRRAAEYFETPMGRKLTAEEQNIVSTLRSFAFSYEDEATTLCVFPEDKRYINYVLRADPARTKEKTQGPVTPSKEE